jgi:hypothetical protein
VGCYINNTSGFRIDALTDVPDPGRETTFVLDVANLIRSDDLMDYALETEESPALLLGS